jgi:hypothetical protein
MKRLLITLVALALLVVTVESGFAQRGNTRGTAMIDLAGKSVSVEYGRPALKGRSVTDLLGQLKAGDAWRVGADKSTTFKTSAALQFGGVTVPSGEYSLWVVRVGDNSWKLVFNKQHGQWGTQHDAAQDLVSAPLTQSEAADSAETVTISLSKAGKKGGAISIQWGTMKLSADFRLK